MGKTKESNKLSECTMQDLYYYYENCYIIFEYYDNLYRSVQGSYPGSTFNGQAKEYDKERMVYIQKLTNIREEIKQRLEEI